MSQSNLTLPTRTEAEARAERTRYTVGSCSPDIAARNHCICEGPHVVAVVNGAGYPAGKGWSPRTEALTHELVRKLNAHDDLLAALKIARVQLGEHKDGMGAAHYHACNIADAAIAKAEGQDEKDREIRERLRDEIRNQGTC